MASLTSDREIKYKGIVETNAYRVKLNETIFQGAFVNIDASGYCKNASDTAGERFAGVCKTRIENSDGNARAVVGITQLAEVAYTSPTLDMVGCPVYAIDSGSVSLTASNVDPCGVCVGVDTDRNTITVYLNLSSSNTKVIDGNLYLYDTVLGKWVSTSDQEFEYYRDTAGMAAFTGLYSGCSFSPGSDEPQSAFAKDAVVTGLIMKCRTNDFGSESTPTADGNKRLLFTTKNKRTPKPPVTIATVDDAVTITTGTAHTYVAGDTIQIINSSLGNDGVYTCDTGTTGTTIVITEGGLSTGADTGEIVESNLLYQWDFTIAGATDYGYKEVLDLNINVNAGDMLAIWVDTSGTLTALSDVMVQVLYKWRQS